MKLWNKNFLLLWQGRFISAIGSAFYSIALSWYIYEQTGSTAIMGLVGGLMAIPNIFLSPIAGTYVDRNDRKRIIVLSDFIDGISVLLLGIIALMGHAPIWLIAIVGIILQTTSIFFTPAMMSSMPDIVGKENLLRANASFSLIGTSAGIIGKLLCGLLYAVVGAPVLFIINGLSYLFSGVSELFISIPKHQNENKKNTFYHDLKEGFSYFIGNKGLKYLYFFIAFLNLFGVMCNSLILPYFIKTLGKDSTFYGFILIGTTIGMMVGPTVVSIVKSKVDITKFFLLSGIINSIGFLILIAVDNVFLLSIATFINGVGISLTNTTLATVLQAAIPADKRGRVSGFRKMLNASLIPIARILAGVLAEFIHIPIIIGTCSILLMLTFITAVNIPAIKSFLVGKEERVA